MITLNEKRAILLSFVIATISGSLISILDNYFQLNLEWGRASHPALYYMKVVHYLVTPFVLISIGIIFKDHIKRKIRGFKKESRRATGAIILIGFALLSLSGQFLLIITNEDIKEIDKYIHGISGILTLIVLLIHLKLKSAGRS